MGRVRRLQVALGGQRWHWVGRVGQHARQTKFTCCLLGQNGKGCSPHSMR